jgi:Zinc carboxypeptidase
MTGPAFPNLPRMTMKKLFVLAAAVFLTGTSFAAPAKHITSPAEAFGFEPGTDRKLADWTQLVAYFQKLGTQSDRIHFEEVGKTTEGRPFITVTISSPDTIAHLDHYKEIQVKLADPRITTPEEAKQLVAQDKTVLVVTCNVHSTEIASSQSATEFAYKLATGDTPEINNILKNVIVVLVPSLNPDGEQLVVDWYKKYLGTPYEGSNPVVLWHHYVGHDDNRDWSSFTQVETRLAVEKVINPWHPQILYDLHQQGEDAARIYLPPFVDPFDPNLDPLLISSINALGANTALDISATGKTGVLSYGVYDFWSPLRDYIAYHNGLRILTESASADIASPVNIPFDRLARGIGYDAKVTSWNFPNPWQGGEWHLGDIVDYQIAAFFSIANNAATFRERFLNNFYDIGVRALHHTDWPYAYVVPAEQSNPATTARLINTLRIGAVDVEQATADFDAGGSHYSKGSYIIRLAQPYGSFAKTLLEIQHYPNIAQYPGGPLQRPYDVTAQTLPLLFGVTAVAVKDPFDAHTSAVTRVKPAPGSFEKNTNGDGYLIGDRTNSSLYALFDLLKQGAEAYRLTGGGAEPGTIYIPAQPGIDAKLELLATKYPVEIHAAATVPTGSALKVKLPRIALYQSWVPSMDEGWTRYIFDQNGIPYTRLVDAEIRKGNLNDRFDVIVLPDNSARAITTGRGGFGEGPGGEPGSPQPASGEGSSRGRAAQADQNWPEIHFPSIPPEYTGGLGEEGVASLKAFVENGGTIVALNKASQVYARKDSDKVSDAEASFDRKSFYIPGSILEVSVDPSNPIAFGSTPTVPIFYENGPVFHVSGDATSVASFTTDKPLLSGWIQGGDLLKGTSAIAEEPEGKGRLVLFGFRPQYRAQSEVTYKFLFNALLYSSSTSEAVGSALASGGK